MFFITNAISAFMLVRGILSISLICYFSHKKWACESIINTEQKGTTRTAVWAGCVSMGRKMFYWSLGLIFNSFMWLLIANLMPPSKMISNYRKITWNLFEQHSELHILQSLAIERGRFVFVCNFKIWIWYYSTNLHCA